MSRRSVVRIAIAVVLGTTLCGVILLASLEEVILTVPEDFRGGQVLADGQVVATIDTPEMIYLRFWRRPASLVVVKKGYGPVTVALACSGDCYPVVTQDQVHATGT